MKMILNLFAASVLLAAQATTRPIIISWTLTNPTGVTGVIVMSSPTPTGAFIPLGCVGTIPASYFTGLGITPINCVTGTTASTTNFVDPNENIGSSVSYEAVAVGVTCPVNNTSSTPCGASVPSVVATVVVPPRPGSTIVVTLNIP